MGGQHQKRRLMKDGLGRLSVERLARNLAIGFPAFDREAFVACGTRGLEALELKDRVRHLAAAMSRFLPKDFPLAMAGIERAIPEWDQGPKSDPLRGFSSWPVFVFVEEQGIEHPELSLPALRDLTHLFTAEFAIRPFIERNPAETMREIAGWTEHSSDQVRRLASEGIRPRLPWAGRLPDFQADPEPVLRILENLKDDESEFVRRSVANCLADVAVDHPDRIIELCQQWQLGASSNRRWIIKRATRNLIKSGHAGVWSLHGFTERPELRIADLQVSPGRVALDQKFEIGFRLHSESKSAQKLVVDFVIHHVKASGKTSPKVFKLSELQLAPGESLNFRKAHAFRNITTRTYYSGVHRIEIQVNGQRHGETRLQLEV
jgi:3-methyladenine DNA glycosylase AlkC